MNLSRANLRNRIHRKAIFFILAIVVIYGNAIPVAVTSASAPAYDVVITNARIVDGSGNPWFRGDVGIKDGRIVRIGRIRATEAKSTIEAKDRIVAPASSTCTRTWNRCLIDQRRKTSCAWV